MECLAHSPLNIEEDVKRFLPQVSVDAVARRGVVEAGSTGHAMNAAIVPIGGIENGCICNGKALNLTTI